VSVKDLLVVSAMALAIAAPWYVAMADRYGLEFLRMAVWQQNVARYTSEVYGHHASTGFFLVPAAIGMLPWTGFLPSALIAVRRRTWNHRQVLRVLTAASVGTSFVFYSLSASKLANYALVFLPPLAILVALWLDEALDQPRTHPVAAYLTSSLLAVFGLALLSIPLLVGKVWTVRDLLGGVPERDLDVARLLWSVVLPGGCVLLVAAVTMATLSLRTAIVGLCATGMIVPLSLVFGAAPILERLYPWEAFGQAIRSESGRVWLHGYRAPSLTFYAGRPVYRTESLDALTAAFANPETAWVVLERDTFERLQEHDVTSHRVFRVVSTGGRMVLVAVSRSHPASIAFDPAAVLQPQRDESRHRLR
jgi:hypothetical protein